MTLKGRVLARAGLAMACAITSAIGMSGISRDEAVASEVAMSVRGGQEECSPVSQTVEQRRCVYVTNCDLYNQGLSYGTCPASYTGTSQQNCDNSPNKACMHHCTLGSAAGNGSCGTIPDSTVNCVPDAGKADCGRAHRGWCDYTWNGGSTCNKNAGSTCGHETDTDDCADLCLNCHSENR